MKIKGTICYENNYTKRTKRIIVEVLKYIKSEDPLFIAEYDEEPLAILVSLEEYELMLETIRLTQIINI